MAEPARDPRGDEKKDVADASFLFGGDPPPRPSPKAPPRQKEPAPREPGGYDLVSLGADGQPGGEGEASDVVSWK